MTTPTNQALPDLPEPFCNAHQDCDGEWPNMFSEHQMRAYAQAYADSLRSTSQPTDAQIREVFLANGFTVKEGQTDLKPYVFQAARALLALGATTQPDHIPDAGQMVATSQPGGVPEGWRLVPTELTPEMRHAWDSAPSGEDDDENMRGGYRAMLTASPTPPSDTSEPVPVISPSGSRWDVDPKWAPALQAALDGKAAPTPPAAPAKPQSAMDFAHLDGRLGGLAAWLRNPANADDCEFLEVSFVQWCKDVEEARASLSAAPPAAGDEAKPMTAEQIAHLWAFGWTGDRAAFVRAIERHHGIGVTSSAEAGKVGG